MGSYPSPVYGGFNNCIISRPLFPLLLIEGVRQDDSQGPLGKQWAWAEKWGVGYAGLCSPGPSLPGALIPLTRRESHRTL
jgi:hypothetical protein